MRMRVREVLLWVGVALLNVLLFVPAFIWGGGRFSLLCVSFEYGAAILLLGAAAHSRLRAVTRALVVVLYSFLLLFLFYQYAVKAFFVRDPALVEDWRFGINLVHFLGGMTSPRWVAFTWGGVIGGLALIFLVERILAALQRKLQAVRSRSLAVAAAAWLVLGGASVFANGPIRVAGARLADNYRASVAARRKLGSLRSAAPDPRNLDLMNVRLASRPNFYFLVVEAYGEVLATWDMADAYRALMARAQARLEAKGFTARTAYSVAPVHSGYSWFSIATMQSGILIDQPDSFAAFESSSRRIPTLTRFFENQGYHTASLEPLTQKRAGLSEFDPYGHELRVTGTMLDYHGPSWGFGDIPDQYSVGIFRTRYLQSITEPRYLFYMAISTHFPFSHCPPFVRDYTALDGKGAPVGDDGDWPPLPGTGKVGSDVRLAYLRSIEYEWRVLTDFLESDQSSNLVVVVIGDHQPRLESNPPGEVTFDTPVHILSKDPAFVQRFAGLGFQPGLYAEPGRTPPLQHEALFSLLVSKLAEAYGTSDTRTFARYFPEGISLAGLNQ